MLQDKIATMSLKVRSPRMEVQAALKQGALAPSPKTDTKSQELNMDRELNSDSAEQPQQPQQSQPETSLNKGVVMVEAVQPEPILLADFESDVQGMTPNIDPELDAWGLRPQQEPEDAKSPSGLKAIVESGAFELTSLALVIACIAVMAFSIEYSGRDVGYDLGLQPHSVRAAMPHAEKHIKILDLVFNVLFTIELILRFLAFRLAAFRSGWTLMDLVLVTVGWLVDTGIVHISLNPMILRLFRLLRLLRLLKVLKAVKVVDTLFLLVKSIQASFGALIWSFFLIWSLQFLMAILVSQLLATYILDGSQDLSKRQDVFRYFGTFWRTVVTMFEISMGNWVPSCRLLMENVSIWYAWFYILYRCCFMFSMIKVITAVFIAETTRCANCDDELAITQKQRAKEQYCSKLRRVFQDLDKDGDGFLTREEFQPLISDHVLSTWLHTLDIDTYDLSCLFNIHDDGDGKLAVGEFIDGLSRVKGAAKSIDLLKVMAAITHMTHRVENIQRTVQENSNGLCSSAEILQASQDTNAKLDLLLRSDSPSKEDNLLRVTEMTSAKLDTLLSAASHQPKGDNQTFVDQDLAIILVKAAETTNAKLDMLLTNVKLPSGESRPSRVPENVGINLLKATKEANMKLDRLLTREDSLYTTM